MGETKPFLKASDLKGTRLELRYEDCSPDHERYKGSKYPLFCRYSLVLTLGKYDIRAEDEDGNIGMNREKRLELGGSWTSAESPFKWDGNLSTPFRDGTHIQWDSLRLGSLPMFVVYEDKAQRLEQDLQDTMVKKLCERAFAELVRAELVRDDGSAVVSVEKSVETIVRTVLAEWPEVVEEIA